MHWMYKHGAHTPSLETVLASFHTGPPRETPSKHLGRVQCPPPPGCQGKLPALPLVVRVLALLPCPPYTTISTTQHIPCPLEVTTALTLAPSVIADVQIGGANLTAFRIPRAYLPVGTRTSILEVNLVCYKLVQYGVGHTVKFGHH